MQAKLLRVIQNRGNSARGFARSEKSGLAFDRGYQTATFAPKFLPGVFAKIFSTVSAASKSGFPDCQNVPKTFRF